MTDRKVQGDHPNESGTRFVDAIASGNPARLAAALSKVRDLSGVPLPPPDPEVLDAFTEGAPWEVVRDYIWMLAHHRPLVPPLSPDETLRRWVEAVLRHPDGAAALQVVLYLRHDDMPFGTAIEAVASYVADRGVRPGREERGAEYLARYLLDHSQTYSRAVKALAVWKDKPVLGGLLCRLTPYVHAEDRPELGL